MARLLRPLSGIYVSHSDENTHINAGVTVTARLLVFLSQLRIGLYYDINATNIDALYDYIHRLDL